MTQSNEHSDAMRAFEAWFSRLTATDGMSETYACSHQEAAWLAWQAATAQAEQLKRDVSKALFPNGFKHPQLQTWEWQLNKIAELAAAEREGYQAPISRYEVTLREARDALTHNGESWGYEQIDNAISSINKLLGDYK